MWVSEGASVPVKKSLSPLHSEYASPLRNKAYNNSGSLQEPQKNPTASSRSIYGVRLESKLTFKGLELKEWIKLVTVGCQVARRTVAAKVRQR